MIEPVPPRPAHGAALTAFDRDPEDFPDVEELDLPDADWADDE